MTSGPTDYPASWRPPGAPAPAAPIEALMLAIDAYISALSQFDFDQFVSRTRG